MDELSKSMPATPAVREHSLATCLVMPPKTEQGVEYLNDILGNPQSSFTIRDTKTFGKVLDVRLPDGTGARWSADGKTFIMFLEKYTPLK